MNFYDSHNHLQDPALIPYQATILKDCAKAQVRKMVVNGTCEEDWAAVKILAESHPTVIVPAYGLHPWHIRQRSTQWLATLRHNLKENPSAVVGEIGLDRWIKDFDIHDQLETFTQQLELAAELKRPITIHCLKAWQTLHDQLSALPALPKGFLLHSYGGSAEMIQPFVRLGGYFSISGDFVHPQKQRKHALLQHIPLDRLLLETDAPAMLPPQHLIKYPLNDETLNHPANIVSIYSFTASLLGITEEMLAQQLSENFKRLFH